MALSNVIRAKKEKKQNPTQCERFSQVTGSMADEAII
jgi:hypothetical protein